MRKTLLRRLIAVVALSVGIGIAGSSVSTAVADTQSNAAVSSFSSSYDWHW